MVVDDSRSQLAIISEYLKGQYKAEYFLDPYDAIEAFKNKKFDIILTDLYMDKISGIELIQEILSIDAAVRCILITGKSSEEAAVSALKQGASGYLKKPIIEHELIWSINRSWKGLLYQYQNRSLLEKYEQTCAKLQISKDELEDKVRERTHELIEAKEKAEHLVQMKSEFIANISHELRTPLHAILSFSQLGNDNYDNLDSKQVKHYFSRVHESGSRLLGQLNNLLDMSRLEQLRKVPTMETCDIYEIAIKTILEYSALLDQHQMKVLQQYTDGSFVEIPISSFSSASELDVLNREMLPSPILEGNKEMFYSIFKNVMSNAIKYSPDNTTIRLYSKDTELIVDNKKVPAVAMSVMDEGVGIPEEELESVFDMFIQSTRTNTGAGGTGIGLAICQKIVMLHHGKIYFEPNQYGGTTLNIILPRKQLHRASL